MKRANFISEVSDMIEEAIMRAQGIGDWMPEPSPLEIANDIANLVPSYAFEESP